MSDALPHHPLAALFPLLDGDEFDALVADIRAHGLRQRIVLHEDMILDGRNRYAACIEAGIEPQFEQFNGADPLAFVISLNLTRRHLSESQRAMVAARIATLHLGDNQHSEGLPIGRASEMMNVGERSVARAKAVLNEGIPELAAAVDSGGISVSRAAEIARLPENEQRKTPFVVHNTGNPECYAAAHLIKAAKAVMGAIDLDPSSCAIANEVVGAAKFYSKEDDGLALPWRGRLWLNPSYATGLVEKFAMRLLESLATGDVTEACCLFNNSTDTKWFQSLGQDAAAICFPAGRKNYWHPDESAFRATSPLQGQSIIYFGNNRGKFVAEFSNIGLVVSPDRPEPAP